MATAAVLPPTDVPTIFNYFLPDPTGEEPFYYLQQEPPAGCHWLHFRKSRDFVEEDAIRTKYYAEVEDLLKKHVPGAKRVFIFDHTIRRNYEGKEGLYVSGPAYRVHVDQTFEAGIQRVYRHLPEDAERLVKSRVRIINIWRPIGHPVHHNPLALFDYRTVDVDNDLVNVRFIYPDRVGGTFTVRHNPKHQWYYLRHQTPSEATLIKCFDSLDQGQARLTPHSAFLDKTSPPDALKRESIEIRALVFDSK